MHRTRRQRARLLPAVLSTVVTGALTALVALGPGPVAARAVGEVQVQDVAATGVPEPGSKAAVPLEARLYLPAGASASAKAPAVLLAHGFGGTQDDVADQARQLADAGFVVLTWTARGFGGSGGRIHLDSPDFEIADASRLLDVLAARAEVTTDGPGDPRVGVTGGSYGGGAALLLAGLDRRVDAVAAVITWNDLRRSLIPNAVAAPGSSATPAAFTPAPGVATGPGVLKSAWTSIFFAAGGGGTEFGPDALSSVGTTVSDCGRFVAEFCDGYRALLAGRPAPASLLRLLQRSSPASVVSRITAPTLLVQGQRDSLFDLTEADATARALAAAGTPVAVDWATGGHDVGLSGGTGGDVDEKRLTGRVGAWFDAWLVRRASPDPKVGGFHVTVTSPGGDAVAPAWDLGGYPGLAGRPAVARRSVAVARDAATITSPRGGSPSSITSLPGLGALAGAIGERDPAGQVATFTSAPVPDDVHLLGSGRVRLRLTSTAPDAVVFVSLLIAPPSGKAVVPRDLVAPVRVALTPGKVRDVDVALPAVAVPVPAGSRIELRVAATDRGYLVPADARRYTVAVPSGQLDLPVAQASTAGKGPGESSRSGGLPGWVMPVFLALLVGLVVAVVLTRRRGAGPA